MVTLEGTCLFLVFKEILKHHCGRHKTTFHYKKKNIKFVTKIIKFHKADTHVYPSCRLTSSIYL